MSVPGAGTLRRFEEGLLRRLKLNKIPYLVYRISPGLGRAVVKVWYQYMTHVDQKQEMVFMNYGYAELGASQSLRLLESDESDRYCIQLYHHLAGAIDLNGRDLLEVGCGRGGGCSYVARYLSPGSITGLDVAPKAVEFCVERHAGTGARFVTGDAEALPFEDACFDIVLNVESSHYYGSMRRFLREVHRILRPGGQFLFADFRDRKDISGLRRLLADSGFELQREADITGSILAALELDNERKMKLINARVPLAFRSIFKEFASTRGTSTYQAFQARNWKYISFIMGRSSGSPD